MKIGTKTINRSISLISSLLNNYRTELDEAYLKAEDALSVSLKVKFSPGKYNTIDIKADISFVTEQVKDSTSSSVDENQLELFSGEEKVISIKRDRRGRVGNPPRFKALGG